jgi:hypothetical protein
MAYFQLFTSQITRRLDNSERGMKIMQSYIGELTDTVNESKETDFIYVGCSMTTKTSSLQQCETVEIMLLI